MKTYVISLKRSKERRDYIEAHLKNSGLNYEIIDAVDGKELSIDDIKTNCDIEKVMSHRNWLNNGAIGCMMSHIEAFKELQKSGQKAAFVVEDDAILPNNILELTTEIEKKIKSDEIIMLYYASFTPCKVSTINGIKINSGQLLYPVEFRKCATTTAYILGHNVAKEFLNKIYPIRFAADSWGEFYDMGIFKYMRLYYPQVVRTKSFKSVIDYIKEDSLKGKISNFINNTKFPFLYGYFKNKRKNYAQKITGNFYLTDEKSPLI